MERDKTHDFPISSEYLKYFCFAFCFSLEVIRIYPVTYRNFSLQLNSIGSSIFVFFQQTTMRITTRINKNYTIRMSNQNCSTIVKLNHFRRKHFKFPFVSQINSEVNYVDRYFGRFMVLTCCLLECINVLLTYPRFTDRCEIVLIGVASSIINGYLIYSLITMTKQFEIIPIVKKIDSSSNRSFSLLGS